MRYIKKYFKFLIYHALSIIDGIINTLGALIGIQKVLDLAMEWAVFTETIRISREMENREQYRREQIEKADGMVSEATKEIESNGN